MHPLVREEDAICLHLSDDEVKKSLVCLSSHERYQGNKERTWTGRNYLEGGFHGVMRDGDEAYADAFFAVLPIKIGETKNFVFLISHKWVSPEQGASIWGISVRRTADGVVYEPYDNGKLYTCSGHWGGEVSAKALTK